MTNPNSPKNTDPFDLKDLKKKLMKTETGKKKVKDHCFINIPSIQERKAEDSNSLIKHISPRHSRSPNGSISGSTIAKIVTNHLASLEIKSPGASSKRQPVSNNLTKLTTSPKPSGNISQMNSDSKLRPYDPLTTSTTSILNKKKPSNNMSTLAYQKKIDSILKRR